MSSSPSPQGNADDASDARPPSGVAQGAPQTSKALTTIIDRGDYKLTLTSLTRDKQLHVLIVSQPEGHTMMNKIMDRTELPRVNLLLSGIDAWSKELCQSLLATRGV